MARPRHWSAITALVTATAIAVLGTTAAYAVSPVDKCEAAKLKIAGKYDFCRLKAEATAAKTGGTPDFSKCDAAFSAKWMSAETAGAGMCPTTGDAASIQTRITTDTSDLGMSLSGGSVSVCGNGVIESGEQCDFNNLNGQTCQTQGFIAGQLSCTPGTCVFDTSGCFATRFVDNGDGTVTDHQTGLMWEKKENLDGIVNDLDPHDADNTYTWCGSASCSTMILMDGTITTTFLPKLNKGVATIYTGIAGCFAGHCDWRLPTSAELPTILLAPYPCGTSPCIDPVFGPTQSGDYWSATTNISMLNSAFRVNFFDGGVDGFGDKTTSYYARAVRGGL
jgi:hypothetical protein